MASNSKISHSATALVETCGKFQLWTKGCKCSVSQSHLVYMCAEHCRKCKCQHQLC